MTRSSEVRRAAAALALLATSIGTATAAAPGSAAAPAAPQPRAQVERTTLTFAVPDCEGCRIQLQQQLEEVPEYWESRTRKVEDGEVSWTIRSKRTFGMSAVVKAPWEGHTGYVTTVAFRYNGTDVGDKVTFKQARKKDKASACWEGTRRDAVTIPLTVREVEVDGVHEKVPGSIAFVRRTQSWLDPMRKVWDGVLGSQEINVCG